MSDPLQQTESGGWVDQLLGWLSATLLGVLCLTVLAGVGSRYLLGSQWRWTEELATFLLVWLVLVGGAAAYRENAHLGIDLLTRTLAPGARHWTELFVHTLILITVCAVLLAGGSFSVYDRWLSGQLMPTLGIRKAWIYLAAPVSGAFYAGFALWNLVRLVKPSAVKEDAAS
jgi:TRAP-type C4-dicarboxylate transport system permease small subunit